MSRAFFRPCYVPILLVLTTSLGLSGIAIASDPFADAVVDSVDCTPDRTWIPPLTNLDVLGPPDGRWGGNCDNRDGTTPGFITVEFVDNVLCGNQVSDLRVYVWDLDSPMESFEVLVSPDNSAFTSVGIVNGTEDAVSCIGADCIYEFDVPVGTYAFVKVQSLMINTERTDDGPEIDAIEASCTEPPVSALPTTWGRLKTRHD